MLQLAIKALVSGALIAAASEVARRYPGWGGLIISLPLTSLLAIVWLWRDGAEPARIADFAIASSIFVVGSLPAFVVLALLVRHGAAVGPALLAAVVVGILGYLAVGWLGARLGLPT